MLIALTACEPPYVPPPTSSGPATTPVRAHAHNDYVHPRPLLDALDHGFESVEVDVRQLAGLVVVAHDRDRVFGTLRGLYLDPLAAIVVAGGGSVHGDGAPFFLWIDLKAGDRALRTALRATLDEYPMLVRFADDGSLQPGAVTVVLSGDEDAKCALVEGPAPRPFVRDSNHYAHDDRPADGRWTEYALAYGDYLDWPGTGAIPDAQRDRLRGLADDAHAKGRRLRLYETPGTAAFRAVAREVGVDFIEYDQLE